MVAPTGASSVSSRTTLSIGLAQRRGLSTPDQSPRSGVSVLTVFKGHLSRANGCLPSVSDDDFAIDCDISDPRRPPCPIDHGATADNQVVHLVPPLAPSILP